MALPREATLITGAQIYTPPQIQTACYISYKYTQKHIKKKKSFFLYKKKIFFLYGKKILFLYKKKIFFLYMKKIFFWYKKKIFFLVWSEVA